MFQPSSRGHLRSSLPLLANSVCNSSVCTLIFLVLCINKALLGIKKDIYISESGEVSTEPPAADVWTLGSKEKFMSIELACRALSDEVPEIVSKKHISFWNSWGVTPPASMIMSRSDLQDAINRVNSWFASQFLVQHGEKYFCNDFQHVLRLIDRLQPALTDDDYIACSTDDRVSHLRGQHAVFSEYDPLSSSTGRLTVKSGLNILTLPRDFRRLLRPKHGKLLQVDFTALEPHTLRCFSGVAAGSDDIYAEVGAGSGVERDIVKVAVMSACYGMSRNTFRSKYRQIPRAAEFFDKIRNALGVLALERIIEVNDSADGILNGFGRPIKCDQAAWVSHFVQSTAVDVACQGFNSVIDRLESSGAHFSPHFLIHDSLILDVSLEHMSFLNKIVDEGFTLESKNYRFPMKIKELY